MVAVRLPQIPVAPYVNALELLASEASQHTRYNVSLATQEFPGYCSTNTCSNESSQDYFLNSDVSLSAVGQSLDSR